MAQPLHIGQCHMHHCLSAVTSTIHVISFVRSTETLTFKLSVQWMFTMQLRVCQTFWTYFTCSVHTYAYCKTGLCNFILYLIQTEHSQRNSAASEANSPQFELWTSEQWLSDAAKINKFQFTVLILEILSVQAII